MFTSDRIAFSPALPPACPLDSVMPPLNNKRPPLSKRNVCPEVSAPNLRASAPFKSDKTVTPGISAALRRRSVSSQSVPEPSGFRKRTNARTFPWTCAMIWASSPTLARVHGQCGCANITRVSPVGARSIFDSAGQFDGTGPTRPGALS